MLIPPGAKAVFFDAVGTLLFPHPPAQEIYAGIACRAGVELSPAEVRQRFLIAFRAEEEIDRLAGWVTSEEREVARWRRIVSRTLPEVPDSEGCFQELFLHFAEPTSWRLAPDAHAVFTHLHERGVVLGMGSNYDARLLAVIAGIPELALVRDRVVISAAVGFRKPAREFFAEVVRVADCQPGEIVFVGDDRENDYEGATAAGLVAVLLDPAERHVMIASRIRALAELLAS